MYSRSSSSEINKRNGSGVSTLRLAAGSIQDAAVIPLLLKAGAEIKALDYGAHNVALVATESWRALDRAGQ
jgi:hypothetical protein